MVNVQKTLIFGMVNIKTMPRKKALNSDVEWGPVRSEIEHKITNIVLQISVLELLASNIGII